MYVCMYVDTVDSPLCVPPGRGQVRSVQPTRLYTYTVYMLALSFFLCPPDTCTYLQYVTSNAYMYVECTTYTLCQLHTVLTQHSTPKVAKTPIRYSVGLTLLGGACEAEHRLTTTVRMYVHTLLVSVPHQTLLST